MGKDAFSDWKIRISYQWLKYGSLGRKPSHKREMLHKQAKNYLLIQKSAEISRCEIRSLLDYDRGQCADSSYLKAWSPYSCNDHKHRRKHVPNSVLSNSDAGEHFDCNITSFTSILINCSVSSSSNDRSHHPRHVSSLVSSCIANLNQNC